MSLKKFMEVIESQKLTDEDYVLIPKSFTNTLLTKINDLMDADPMNKELEKVLSDVANIHTINFSLIAKSMVNAEESEEVSEEKVVREQKEPISSNDAEDLHAVWRAIKGLRSALNSHIDNHDQYNVAPVQSIPKNMQEALKESTIVERAQTPMDNKNSLNLKQLAKVYEELENEYTEGDDLWGDLFTYANMLRDADDKEYIIENLKLFQGGLAAIEALSEITFCVRKRINSNS